MTERRLTFEIDAARNWAASAIRLIRQSIFRRPSRWLDGNISPARDGRYFVEALHYRAGAADGPRRRELVHTAELGWHDPLSPRSAWLVVRWVDLLLEDV